MGKKLLWFTIAGNEFPECKDCLARMTDPAVVHACASVGLEHDSSTHEMMKEHLAHYHQRGHK